MPSFIKLITCTLLAALLLGLLMTSHAYAHDTDIAVENLDIPALRVEAQDILQKLPDDEVPKPRVFVDEKWQSVPLKPDAITDGVISDYITIIKFMAARKTLAENRRDPMNPPAPRYFQLQSNKLSTLIFHYKANYSFENDSGQQTFPTFTQKNVRFNKVCIGECAKILFEDYADEVIFVAYHPETKAIIPESIRSFRRKPDCDISVGHFQSFAHTTHALPAIGLCFQTEVPEKPLEMARRDGLHVYTNMASPFWPEEFEADHIAVGPSSSRLPIAFETLEHIKAFSSITHKAFGVKVGENKESYTIKYEHACVTIKPPLPERAIKRLVGASVGEAFVGNSYNNDKPLNITDGGICHGKVRDQDAVGFFKRWDTVNGRVEFAKIFSPQEVEDKLTASMMKAKAKGADADAEWGAIAEAIFYLEQYHPGFENDIAQRVAPILIELARYDLDIGYRMPIKILKKMPHESLSDYVDELVQIMENHTEELGCKDLKCPKAEKGG